MERWKEEGVWHMLRGAGVKKKKICRGKRGIVSEALPWILISIAILAILMVSILVMKDKGIDIIDRVKSLFKFR